MASGTADLQRDLGGAIMQSILGALLTAGYAAAVTKAIAGSPDGVHDHGQHPERAHEVVLERRRHASQPQYPQYAKQIIAGAKQSFVDGQDWAYLAGIIAILLGAALVFFFFPKQHHEDELLATYRAEDRAAFRAATAQQGTPGLRAHHPRRRPGSASPRQPTFHGWTRTPLDRTRDRTAELRPLATAR